MRPPAKKEGYVGMASGKKKIMKKEIGIQTQVQLEKTLMEEDSSNKEIDRKIEEMDRKVRKLEG